MKANILITGVSSGIGFGLAKKYLELGATVFGISRRKPKELVSPRFHFQPIDLNIGTDIAPALERFNLEKVALDAVILNAGIYGKISDLREAEISHFRNVMMVNVWANKILLDYLLETCANIDQVVAVSSRAAVSPYRGSGAYCISKSALNMLISLYATENPATHFSTISPPIVDTAIQDYLTGFPSDERYHYLEALKNYQTNGGMLSPDDAAPVLLQAFELARKYPSGSFVTAAATQKTFMKKLSNRIGMSFSKVAVPA